MNKYTKTTYVNDSEPYLCAENLNNTEDGLETVTDEVINLETVVDTKASKTDLDTKADKSDLDAKADKAELEAKADKTALDEKANKSDIPDVSVYAKTTDIEASYAKKTEIPDITPLASKEALEQAETTLQAEIETKADTSSIPTKLPTPNAFKMTINGTTYTFDGSSEVVIELEDANGKEF